jgi:gluconokinase
MPARVLLIMGVAGSGKTTVGRALADSLCWRFTDADDFHPPANIVKMTAGSALTDTDRTPWLAALRAHIDTHDHVVLACSALKASYRAQLIANPDRAKLIYLRGTHALLAARLAARTGHFATPALLDSQLATLEEPSDVLTLDIANSPTALVAEIRSHFRL